MDNINLSIIIHLTNIISNNPHYQHVDNPKFKSVFTVCRSEKKRRRIYSLSHITLQVTARR